MSMIERIEGRRHAVSVLRSILGMPKAFVLGSDIVKNLREANAQRENAGFKQGVQDVLELVEAGQ